jgi:O-antigen/teichoic acid export membrane protein
VLVLGFPALLCSLMSFKAGQVLTRHIVASRSSGDTGAMASICVLGFALDVVPALFVALGVALTSQWVARQLWDRPEIAPLMIDYALSLPVSALLGTASAVLISCQRFGMLAAVRVGEQVMVLALTGLFFWSGWRLHALVWSSAVGEAAAGLVAAIVAVVVMGRGRIAIGRGLFLKAMRLLDRDLLASLVANYWAVSVAGVLTQMPVILLGRFRGPEEAGFYRLAATGVVAAGYVESSLTSVAYPELAVRWAQGQRAELLALIKRWTTIYSLPVASLVLLAAIAAPSVVGLVLGSSFAEVGLVTQILLTATVVSTTVFWVCPLYFAAGRFGRWAAVHTAYAAVAVSLSWISAAWIGLYGVAGVAAISKIVTTGALTVMVAKWSELRT